MVAGVRFAGGGFMAAALLCDPDLKGSVGSSPIRCHRGDGGLGEDLSECGFRCVLWEPQDVKVPFHVFDLKVSLFLLAGLGGEGEEEGDMMLLCGGVWWGGLPRAGIDSAVDAAVPKLWHRVAMAILGHRDGLAALDCFNLSSFFLRCSASLLVPACRGGEGIDLCDAVAWEDAGVSGSLLVQPGELCSAALGGCYNLWFAGTSTSYELYCYMSGCCALHLLGADVHDEDAFLLFGTCRRRMRAFLLWFLRFNRQEPPDLSSVMTIIDLQLNPLLHRHLPT